MDIVVADDLLFILLLHSTPSNYANFRCKIEANEAIPPSFWAAARATATYIRNRCPTNALYKVTPHKVWYG